MAILGHKSALRYAVCLFCLWLPYPVMFHIIQRTFFLLEGIIGTVKSSSKFVQQIGSCFETARAVL